MTTLLWIRDLVCTFRSNDPEKSKYEIQAELDDIYHIKVGYNTFQKIVNISIGRMILLMILVKSIKDVISFHQVQYKKIYQPLGYETPIQYLSMLAQNEQQKKERKLYIM